MELKARDIMIQDYKTVYSDAPVSEAIRLIFKGRVRATGYKPFGIMVVDHIGRLTGMVSMFDILYHLRPPFMNYELQSLGISEGELELHLGHFKGLRVEQVMNTPVVTIPPDEQLMVIIDLMTKKRVRRLPVVEGDQILGIVYISDVFLHLCETWLKPS